MTAFQIAGLSLCGLMALASLRSLIVRPGRRTAPLFWLVVWSAATAAFVAPDATTVLARTLGIERGADMVLYSAALAGAVGFWIVSLRLRAQNRAITRLARELALRDAREPTQAAAPDTGTATAPDTCEERP